MTLQELFFHADAENPLTADRLERAKSYLQEKNKSDMPWYLCGLIGLGAWLASIFFFLFAGLLLSPHFNKLDQLWIPGLVVLAVAVTLGRLKLGIFIEQACLAASLAGQGMIYLGLFNETTNVEGKLALLSSLLALILYVTYPDLMSRFITSLIASQCTFWWLKFRTDTVIADRALPFTDPLLFVYWLLGITGILFCFLRARSTPYFNPLGYAIIISLVITQINDLQFSWFAPHFFETWFSRFQPSAFITALALIGTTLWATGGWKVAAQRLPLYAGLIISFAALIILGAGYILLALLFFLLGFALQNRLITGIALILLPLFLLNYYYNLRLDLLTKSGVLIASGLFLLLLRVSLQKWVFTAK